MKVFSLFLVLWGILLPFGSAHSAESGQVSVTDAWIREAPPGARVMGGYLTLKNMHDDDVVITGSKSSMFKKVEIHKTEVADGIARMVHQKRLHLKSGSSLKFESGGLHLMMMMPNGAISKGDVIDITFQLETGEEILFQAPVQRDTLN